MREWVNRGVSLRSIAAAGFFVVAGCADQTGGGSVTAEERKAIALRYAEELWERGNVDIIDELCTPDFWWADAIGEPIGVEDIKRLVKSLRSQFPDQKTVNNVTLVDGDWVANKWIVRATHAATGTPLTYWGNVMLRFEDDEIAEEWGTHTMFFAMQQAGIPLSEE